LGLNCGAQKLKEVGLSAYFYQVREEEKKVEVVVESASV